MEIWGSDGNNHDDGGDNVEKPQNSEIWGLPLFCRGGI